MSLSAALMKPQVFVAPPAVAQGDELQLLLDIAEVLASDPELALRVSEIVGQSFERQMRDFLVSRQERLSFAYGKASNLFAPIETTITELVEGLQDDPLATLPAIVQAINSLAQGLMLANVKDFAGALWDLIETDLGVSPVVVREFADDTFTLVVDRLQAPLIQGVSDEQAMALFNIGGSIDNLRVFLLAELDLPSLDKQLVLSALERLWRLYDLDDIMQRVSQALNAGEEILEPLANIVQCIIQQLESSPSVGAANGTTEVTDETERSHMAWYASWVKGETVKYSNDTTQPLNLHVNPELLGFTYKHISVETMEKIAFHSAWSIVLVDVIFHAASIKKGDIWGDITNIMVDGIDVTLIAWPEYDLPSWARWLGKLGFTALAGLEGHQGRWEFPWDDDPYIWFNMFFDLSKAISYRNLSSLLRDALLSFLTLLNNDPQAAQQWREQATSDAAGDTFKLGEIDRAWKTRNNNHFHGLCFLLAEPASMMLPGILSATDKENYGFDNIGALIGKAIGGLAITNVFSYSGIFLSYWAAGEWPNDWTRYGLLIFKERTFGNIDFTSVGQGFASVGRILFSLITYLLGHIGYLYMFADGDSDDGKYCLDLTGNERKYMGYPEKDTSPYVLPWEDGQDEQCVQGNMGIWSHYPVNLQVYAFDFSHAEGDAVLCSRAGVIWSVEDGEADHNKNDWNFIQIIHVIVNPASGGLPGVTASATTYADGTTPIPAGTVFPPYPHGFNPPLRESAGHPAGTTFAFIDPVHDRAIAGRTYPADTPFGDDPNTDIPTDRVYAPDAADPPLTTTTNHPEGTTFLPPATAGGNYEPMLATFALYGHGLNGFVNRVFGTNDVVGEFIPQGRAIMEAGDTGISAFNHLHMHVVGWPYNSGTRDLGRLSIPFVFRGEGIVKSQRFYTSNTTRVT